MKKLMGISVIAALAVLPMAANADISSVTLQGTNGTVTANTNIATTSYVQGAYNDLAGHINTNIAAINTLNGSGAGSVAKSIQDNAASATFSDTNAGLSTTGNTVNTIQKAIDAVDTRLDTLEANSTTADSVDYKVKNDAQHATYSANTNYDSGTIGYAIKNMGSNSTLSADGTYVKQAQTVAENLTALDTQVKSNTDHIGTMGSLSGDAAEATTLVGAINAVDTALDGRLDTLEGAVGTENSVLYKIDHNAASAAYTNDSMSGVSTISGAIADLDNRLDTAETNIGTIGNLTTTATNLVAAINEVKSDAATQNAKVIKVYDTWDSSHNQEVALSSLPAATPATPTEPTGE